MRHASPDSLIALARAIFSAAGSDEAEARKVAENLVEANLCGHDSHGIGMIPRYVDNAVRGVLTPNQNARVTGDTGAILQIDGGMGYGQVIGAQAMDHGIAKAKATGAAIVALRNSHHLGRIGAWGEQCADAGLVSIHYVNVTGHPPLVAPHGGAEGRYSTNPYCAAVPGTDETPPIILDMATSKVAMGKVRVAYNKGERVAEDILISPDGTATTDPGVMFREPRGAILPIGAHKGYGLALFCELLGGALTNGPTCLPHHQARETVINNMLSIILDPAALGDDAYFRSELDAVVAYVTSAAPAAGVGRVMVPGDPERNMQAARRAGGIPVDDATWQEIRDSAAKAGLGGAALDGLMAA